MRILIAEDEVTIARVLKVMLEKNKYAVDMVHNGSDALDYIQAVGYDALVLDIMMPGKDGIEVLKAARAEGNTTPTLFLTAKAEVADRVVGLDAGADDYLPKPFAANEFLARVRALTRRSNTYASFALSFGNVTLDCCQYLLKTAFEEVRLNNKEFQLTELFLRHPRQVFSSEHLMEKVWGLDSEAEMDVVWGRTSASCGGSSARSVRILRSGRSAGRAMRWRKCHAEEDALALYRRGNGSVYGGGSDAAVLRESVELP